MTTYADPSRCPDCRAPLPHAPVTCAACALPLTGTTAATLFTTLQEADRLLGVLRAQKQPVPVTAAAPAAPGSGGHTPYPVSGHHPEPRAPRLPGASVPKILLSLGALCLLVAAVIFLAVAWSWLGVGGRTCVLIVLTAASLGLSVVTAGRSLRTAAEALAAVGLGLLAVDVVGVHHAGWLGPADDSSVVLLGGAVVATAALVVLAATSRRPLVVPALVTPVAVLVAGLGAQADAVRLVPIAVTLVLLLGSARLGASLPSRPLGLASLATGTLAWLGFVVASAVQLAEAPVTIQRYVGHVELWPLLVAAVLAAVVGPASGTRRYVERVGYAVAGLTGTCALVLPALDNGATAAIATLTAAALVWVGVLQVVIPALRRAAVLPLAGTLVAPVAMALALLGAAAAAVFAVGAPFSRPFDVRIAAPTTPVTPLLLVPVLLVVAAAGCGVARLVRRLSPRAWVAAVGSALGLGALATLPLYGAPLAVVVATLLAAALGVAIAGDAVPAAYAEVRRLAALGLGLVAAAVALPSDVLTSVSLLVVCVMSATFMVRHHSGGSAVALPLAFAGLAWAGGSVIGLDEQFRAVPVLVVLGALAIWRPRLELEAASAVAGAAVATASVLLASDVDVSLAVHLTLAGVIVTASSLVHPSRRLLAWPGGLLLAAATWVRLADLGVHVPEAYTLPSALVLTAVGAWRLRRDDRSATLTVLLPGLTLATLPSLVAMLHDPYSLRALLLGTACVGLALGGAAARWGAPLVVGAAVGAVLVLRELAPYAAEVPSWLAIGVAGSLLLAVGITWESRMADVRRASRYVAALR